MTVNRLRRTALPLGIAGMLATAAVLSGGSVSYAKPKADQTAAKAQAALAKGQIDKAISLSEAVVQASPRDPAYRALLGHAYLRAGRFESAATAFDDAMQLGDNSARTALALALASAALGQNGDAVAILNDWRDAIPASDLGLALALAGETGRGVAVLGDALRGGDASAKVRQNLAYAYALDGRWREARLMAAQDVPADQINARIAGWAVMGKPEDGQKRVAALLGVPLRGDPGQPAVLALNAGSQTEQLAAEASAAAAQVAVATAAPAPVEQPVAEAPAPIAPVVALASNDVVAAPVAAPAYEQSSVTVIDGIRYVSNPVVQAVPAAALRAAPVRTATLTAPRRAYKSAPIRVEFSKIPVARTVAKPTHLVQLGSFASAQGARRGWGVYAARTPSLKNYKMTIIPVVVRGKNYWRVAASGFDARGATGLCSTLKSRGGMCFAYAAPRAVSAPALAMGMSGPARARR